MCHSRATAVELSTVDLVKELTGSCIIPGHGGDCSAICGLSVEALEQQMKAEDFEARNRRHT